MCAKKDKDMTKPEAMEYITKNMELAAQKKINLVSLFR